MARILVVDDEEDVRQVMRRLMALNGHEVDTACGGAEALDLLQKESYDLLIIDNMMPRISGVDAVGIIRTSSKHKKLKILMFSAVGLTERVEAAFAAGVDGYMTKPFVPQRLFSKVENMLDAGAVRE